MNSLLSRAPRYRHIVFADDLIPPRRAVNLTPQVSPGPSKDDTGLLSIDAERFINWLMEQGDLNPQHYQRGTLARRLPACLRALRATSPDDARRRINETPSLISKALNALVIGVTSFFRDSAVFARLQDEILPDLLQKARGVRVWSAGCSDGHELYSVAMMLAELNVLFRSNLLGTDCRQTAVAAATAGLFMPQDLANVPAAARQRFFVAEGQKVRALDVLRKTMLFRRSNILEQPEAGPFDLILCRNLAIYLHPESAGRLWLNLEKALRPGGVLVLGKAESPAGSMALTQLGPCIFRRNRG